MSEIELPLDDVTLPWLLGETLPSFMVFSRHKFCLFRLAVDFLLFSDSWRLIGDGDFFWLPLFSGEEISSVLQKSISPLVIAGAYTAKLSNFWEDCFINFSLALDFLRLGDY